MHLKPILALALLSTAAAYADVTIEYKMEGPMSATTITRIKGDMVRSDTGEMTTSYLDTKTGDTVLVMNKTADNPERTITKQTGAETKKSMEEMKKMMEQLGQKATADMKMVATGKTEKVGEYDTTVHTLSFTGGMTTFYIAKDFPNYASVKADIETLARNPAQTPGYTMPEGLVVKSVTEVAGTKTTMSIVSIKTGSLDAALFVPPTK